MPASSRISSPAASASSASTFVKDAASSHDPPAPVPSGETYQICVESPLSFAIASARAVPGASRASVAAAPASIRIVLFIPGIPFGSLPHPSGSVNDSFRVQKEN